MPLTDDFFTDDPETVTAIFTLADLSTVEVPGVFRDHSDSATQYGMDIEAVQPTFECETADISGVTRKNTVVISATNYVVEKVTRIGVGLSVVYLKEVD